MSELRALNVGEEDSDGDKCFVALSLPFHRLHQMIEPLLEMVSVHWRGIHFALRTKKRVL